MKNKLKTKTQEIAVIATFSLLLFFGLISGLIGTLNLIEKGSYKSARASVNTGERIWKSIATFLNGGVEDYAWTVTVPKTKAEEELPIKDYVRQEVEKAGLKWEDVNNIITKESNWREDICIIEPNKTISCGLWMINTVHNKTGMTNACKVDYKCATEWAINKRLKDGNYCAWSVAKPLGLCK
jgi:hypothetical protein